VRELERIPPGKGKKRRDDAPSGGKKRVPNRGGRTHPVHDKVAVDGKEGGHGIALLKKPSQDMLALEGMQQERQYGKGRTYIYVEKEKDVRKKKAVLGDC